MRHSLAFRWPSFHVQEVVSSVKAKDETCNAHQWLSNPRRLKIEPSNPILHCHCVRCGRDFITDPSSGIGYAVFVSVISFDQLSDEVTKRWLSEPCPGRHLSSDDDDRTKIVAAFRVSSSVDMEVEVSQPERRSPRADRLPPHRAIHANTTKHHRW